jgi:hypothetical protein
MRQLSLPLAAVIAAAGLAVDSGAAAARPAPRHCATVHVTISLHPTTHSQFGAFSLNEAGSSCATAKTVALAYMTNPKAVGESRHTITVKGWACTWRAPKQPIAQQADVTCALHAARIAFTFKIPSG